MRDIGPEMGTEIRRLVREELADFESHRAQEVRSFSQSVGSAAVVE